MREAATPERLAAEALVEGAEEDGVLETLPTLCRRRHSDACRLAILARADHYIATREVPHA